MSNDIVIGLTIFNIAVLYILVRILNSRVDLIVKRILDERTILRDEFNARLEIQQHQISHLSQELHDEALRAKGK